MSKLTTNQIVEMHDLLVEASEALSVYAPNDSILTDIDDFLNATHDYFFWIAVAKPGKKK